MMMRRIFLFLIIASLVLLGYRVYSLEKTQRAYNALSDTHTGIERAAVREIEVADDRVSFDQQEELITYTRHPFRDLLDENSDFSGWLQVPNTAISYPVVKSSDNEYYLDRDFYGNKTPAGSIFMDYRNLGSGLDTHTILYGHNMKDGTMFHNLRYFKDLDFFQNNRRITVETLYGEKTYEIFSVYPVSAETYTLSLEVDPDYTASLLDRSIHGTLSLDIPAEAKLLTLATCTYEVDDGRLILHAYEIETPPGPDLD